MQSQTSLRNPGLTHWGVDWVHGQRRWIKWKQNGERVLEVLIAVAKGHFVHVVVLGSFIWRPLLSILQLHLEAYKGIQCTQLGAEGDLGEQMASASLGSPP